MLFASSARLVGPLRLLLRGDLKGQGDDKGRANALPAGHFDGAVHFLHQAPDDGHAQARALIDAAGVGVLLGKGLEEVL